jgi:hypothetical protein
MLCNLGAGKSGRAWAARGECDEVEVFWSDVRCRTFSDKSEETDILDTLQHIADELERDLARTGFAGRCVCVKFKVSF